MKRSIVEMSEFISKLTAFDLLLFFTFNTHTHTPKKDTGRTPFFFHFCKSNINLQKERDFLAGQFHI